MGKTIPVECAVCGTTFDKPLKRFNQTIKLGKQHTCSRTCASKLTNEQRRCEPITSSAKNTRKDKEKYPEKNKARELVRRALKTGKLIPPEECEYCFRDDKSLEAHHPDHLRPFLISFFCKECHALADSDSDKWEDLATDYSSQIKS